MNMNFNLNTPTNLIFGSGKLNELGAQKLPGKKALLLISSGKSAKISGALERTQEQLEKAGAAYVVCANIHENPTKELVMEAAAVAKENGCDFIVALGGGAVLDSATAISAMATNPGDLWDYVYGGTGKGQPLVNPGLPVVTIATSSGTGSEINCWGVISNLDTHEKIGFGSPILNPVLAIVDPVENVLNRMCVNPMQDKVDGVRAMAMDVQAEFDAVSADTSKTNAGSKALIKLRNELVRLYGEQQKLAASAQSDSKKALTDGLLADMEQISRKAHETVGFTYTPLEQLAALQ